ncbi:MAG TPA: hypothetical protein DIV47_00510 [Candidatus Pacebacteria bacterium]|nr:hypothetical protein [Candidatus Paceibacterota bacterium]
MKRNQFLTKLTQEAQLQAKIYSHTVVPKQLEPVASFIGNHTWKALLIISGLMALLQEVRPL